VAAALRLAERGMIGEPENIMLFHALYIVAILAEAMTAALAAGDVLCNDIPLLFRSELYASVSVVAGSLYVGGLAAGLPHDPVMIVAMAAGLVLRLLAIRYGWNMPKFVYTRDLH
jgi:uncharacterized membrane protein YeiH